MKHVLITGANGFIGKQLVKRLAEEGYYVTAIIRKDGKFSEEYVGMCRNIIYCDIEDYSHIEEMIPVTRYEYLFHLAWAGSSGSLRGDHCLQLLNARAAGDIAAAAGKIMCRRFIGVGSITQIIYSAYLRMDGSEPEKTAIYAIAKNAAEQIARCQCINAGTEYIWTYCTNIYGVGDFSENFISFLVREYLAGKTPELTEGKQMADFLHVSDLVNALISVAKDGMHNHKYYIGYGSPRPLKEFVRKVYNTVKPQVKDGLGIRKYHGMELDYNGLEIDKLFRDTGFLPRISFEQGISEVIEWEKAKLENRLQLKGISK